MSADAKSEVQGGSYQGG